MKPFFWEVQHIYCAIFMLAVAYNGNPILNNIYTDKKKIIHNKM